MKQIEAPDKHALTVLKDRKELESVISSLLRDMDKPAKSSYTSNGYSRSSESRYEAHLRDYWRILRKHLWLVAGMTILITTVVAFYLVRKPDVFEAQSRVEVDLETVNPSLGASKNSSVIVNNPINYPAYFNTQLKILSGPGLLRRVAKNLDLEHNKTFLHYLPSQNGVNWTTLKRIVGLKDTKKDESRPQSVEELSLGSSNSQGVSQAELEEATRLSPIVEELQDKLKVEAVRETGQTVKETYLIDISFTHPDRVIAAKIVNAIGDTFVLSNLENKTSVGSVTGDFLQKRIVELQSQIRSGEEELENYAKNHQILSLDASQNTVVDRLSGLNKELLEAENERKTAEASYKSALQPGAAVALAEDALKKNDDRQLAEIQLKLVELQQRRSELLAETTEEWPEVKQINSQISALQKQVQDARSRAAGIVMTNLETHFREAQSREDALRKSFDEQRGETLTQNEAAINYHIIQQGIETNKNLLDGLLQRAKENEVVLAGTPNNIRVIDYAIAPRKPSGPRRVMGVALAFFFALSFGMGFAFFLEYLDDTVRTTEDVEDLLRLPAIGVIPAAGKLLARTRKKATALSLANRTTSSNPELLVNADSRSPLAEAYRQLRTSVLLSTAGRAPKTLLVTSSQPAEGKTTTAVNLAISLSQTGAEVLIIDADMRRPRLHNVFGTTNKKGLSSYLSSEMADAEVFAMIEQHSSNLHVLASGPIPPNPAELLGSEQMRRLINTLQSTFTHIVIDSPPTLSFTDSVLLSSLVDGVLMVVHSGTSSRQIVRRTAQLLEDVGAKIFGVVLNNVTLVKHDYYYRKYYDATSYYSSVEPDADLSASGNRG